MTPLFTIHAGEYLVGSFIEKKFERYNVWIPSKDKGIDLLITDKSNSRTASIQVKFSKDYSNTVLSKALQKNVKSFGWWSLKREDILKSKADYWVFVMLPFTSKNLEFVIIDPMTLSKFLTELYGPLETFRIYLLVTDKNKCWETRSLRQAQVNEIGVGKYFDIRTELTQYLNAWEVIEAKLDE